MIDETICQMKNRVNKNNPSFKFNGKQFEEIRKNFGLLKTFKQVRILQT